MTPARKRIAILIVVIGTGLIVGRVIAGGEIDSRPDEVSIRPGDAQRPDPPVPAAATVPVPTLLRLDRLEARRAAAAGHAAADPLFAALSWQAPKPKVVAPPTPLPLKPVPPPFPYPYIGGLSDDGVRTGFFTRGERVMAVRAGDTVDAAFRIEQLGENQMTLTYLPLDETVTVVFGAVR
jgi:hypothetical protein